MATVSMANVLSIISQRETIARAMSDAVALHGKAIMQEIKLFDTQRNADAAYWARLCVIKSILSPGAKLVTNIAAAHRVHEAMMQGFTPESFDDLKHLISGTKYGCACYGNNVRALLGSWSAIKTLGGETMTWEALTALTNANVLHGQQEKARSWSLALYDAKNRLYTLDRHMLRGLCQLAGIPLQGELSISKGAYVALAEFMLTLHDDVCGKLPPLASQWALWNEFRHANHHASHAALAR